MMETQISLQLFLIVYFQDCLKQIETEYHLQPNKYKSSFLLCVFSRYIQSSTTTRDKVIRTVNMWIQQPNKVNVLNLAPLDSWMQPAFVVDDVMMAMMVPSNIADTVILLNCDKCICIVLDFWSLYVHTMGCVQTNSLAALSHSYEIILKRTYIGKIYVDHQLGN